MRAFKLICAGLFIGLSLSACSLASQAEDQSYVLVMGLDRRSDGRIEMTVTIPKVSGNSGENTGNDKPGNYMHISVSADDYEGALEKLDWASPRNVNLAQIKLIVVSQALASEDSFGDVIANIAQTERLFTATKVAVCEGAAKEMVHQIQPHIGTRLSTDIESMFDHYNDRGYVPESSLADLYYQTESVYSDPMVTYMLVEQAAVEKENGKQNIQAFATEENAHRISIDCESEISARCVGAALFSDGSMQGILGPNETILVNLLRNELNSFRYESGGQSLEFVPTRPVYLSVNTKGEPAAIRADIMLSYAAQERVPNEAELKEKLMQDLKSVIKQMQRINVEPFGFAERAARSFLTIEDWVDFDWKARYPAAEIEISLRFAKSDT